MHFVRRASEDPKSQRARHALLHRAERLVTILNLPVIPKEMVAQEVLMIFKAGCAYCNQLLTTIFLDWLLSDSLKETSACRDCKSFKKEDFTSCASCRTSLPTH